MRAIKFRAWNGLKMRGIEKNDWFSIRNDGLVSMNLPYASDPVLMQYTGLKDKNGVEIYESDVVRHHCVPDYYNNLSIGVIEWDAGRSQFRHSRYSEEYLLGYKLEVIGNVYENGDLLK